MYYVIASDRISVTEKDYFFSKSNFQWCLLEICAFDGSWKQWSGIIAPIGKEKEAKVMD